MSHSKMLSLTFLRALPAAFAVSTLMLSGCALDNTSPPATIAMSGITGVLHGGPNPIKNATVRLWQTTSGGYGAAAVQLGPSATTDGYGSFSFDPVANPYTCTTGQFVYITATGGNTGGFTANPNSVQMAALGSCSNFDTPAHENNVRVSMSEVSTLAAGYALSNFMTINQNGGTGQQLVNIGAPANNNAASGTCTVATQNISSCVAAGLSHAFATAANLVDAVHFDGTSPTGFALSAPASNSSGVAPQALLNALGNTLQACTNTTGGVAGDGSPCGHLFSYTTLTSSSNSTNSSSSIPVDELSAVINIAKAPTNNATNLFNLSTPVGFFAPSLTTAPTDLSLAVWYPITITGSSTAWPLGVALDANDNPYVLSQDISTQPAGGSALSGFTSTGASSWTTGLNTSLCYALSLAADANGYLWYSNHEASTNTCPGNGTAGAAAGVYGFTSSAPTITSPTYTIGSTLTGTSTNSIAIDRHNNVWMDKSSSSASFFEFAPPYTGAKINIPNYVVSSIGGVSIDANQNVWVASNNATSTGSIYVMPNQSAALAPAYGTTTNNYYPTTAFSSLSGSNATSGSSSIAFDSAGNGWVASNLVVSKVVPTSTASQSVNITNFACSTCTLMTFTTGTQSPALALKQYIYVSGLTHTAYSNAAYQLTSAVTATSVKTTLCTGALPCSPLNVTACSSGSPCPVIASTADTTGTATLEPVATSFSSPSNIAISTSNPANLVADGTNTLWTHSNSSGGTVSFVNTVSGVAQTINPCYLPGAATTCQTGGMTFGGRLGIDSAGNIWTVSGTSGALIEIIGSAAPIWPLTAYSQPGVMPQ